MSADTARQPLLSDVDERPTRITHNTTRSSGDSAIGSGLDNGFGATLTVDSSQVDHNSAASPTFAGGIAIANVGTAILNRS